MTPILLIGGGGHCKAVIDVIESEAIFLIFGILDSKIEKSELVLGYPIVGNDEDITKLFHKVKYALITVGQIKSPAIRIDLFNKLKESNYRFPRIISPHARLSPHSIIGDGSVIMHGAIISAGVKIGVNCIINHQALVDHDVFIGDHCHISTGAQINGAAIIESKCFVGSGAVIYQGVRIGEQSIISAGCIVRNDVPPNTLLRAESCE